MRSDARESRPLPGRRARRRFPPLVFGVAWAVAAIGLWWVVPVWMIESGLITYALLTDERGPWRIPTILVAAFVIVVSVLVLVLSLDVSGIG